jgi:hypothetical protein
VTLALVAISLCVACGNGAGHVDRVANCRPPVTPTRPAVAHEGAGWDPATAEDELRAAAERIVAEPAGHVDRVALAPATDDLHRSWSRAQADFVGGLEQVSATGQRADGDVYAIERIQDGDGWFLRGTTSATRCDGGLSGRWDRVPAHSERTDRDAATAMLRRTLAEMDWRRDLDPFLNVNAPSPDDAVVTNVVDERLDGVETRRYTVALGDRYGIDESGAAPTMDVWVADDGLVRRTVIVGGDGGPIVQTQYAIGADAASPVTVPR